MKKYKAILFDLDGTLLDTLEDLVDSVNAMLLSLGYPCRSRSEVRSYLGNGVGHLVVSALGERGTEKDAEKGLAFFKEHYAEHSMEKTCPYPGILDLLEGLRKNGFVLGVVTNKVDAAAQPLIEHYFPGVFDVVVGQREDIPRKPAPDMILNALGTIGVAADQCLYVGDSEVDKATADSAHVNCALVTWGYRDAAMLLELAPRLLVSRPEEFLKSLE